MVGNDEGILLKRNRITGDHDINFSDAPEDRFTESPPSAGTSAIDLPKQFSMKGKDNQTAHLNKIDSHQESKEPTPESQGQEMISD